MQYIGLDIIEICRIEDAVATWGDRFLRRVYTDRELRFAAGRASWLAGRFASKEAVAKALGTGIGKIAFKDIEIIPGAKKKPRVILHGASRSRARRLGLSGFAISLSHSRDYAAAVALGEAG